MQIQEDTPAVLGSTHGRSRRGRRLAFAGMTIVLVLALLEGIGALAYRFLLPESDRAAVEAVLGLGPGGWNDTLRYRPHPYLNYVASEDYRFPSGLRPHNAIGFRDSGVSIDPRRDGTLRIVALGASTTYGMFHERVEQVWPHLVGLGLSETLDADVEVVNGGLPCYTTYEIVGQAAFWLPELRPDLVFLHVGLNDAFAVGYPDEGGPDGTRFRRAFEFRGLPETARGIMRASRLVRLAGAGMLRRGGYLAGDLAAAIQHARPSGEELERNIEQANGKYFRRNVETLIALVRNAGARPVLVEMPLNPEFEQGRGVYYDAVSRAVVRNNGILADLGERFDVPVVRLYDRIRDPAAFVDAAHVTTLGMRYKAQSVYDAALPIAAGLLTRPADNDADSIGL